MLTVKRLFLVIGLLLCASAAHAATCPISAGASQSTISSTITNCASGNSVSFAAGSYSMNSSVNVPCGVTITGPVVGLAKYTGSDGYVRMGYTPTATITWTGGAETSIFQYGACSTAAAFQYMEVNGGRPSPDGGQVLYFNPGVSNFTIFGNFLHGNQGNTNDGNWFQDGLIEFDGSPTSAVDNGDSVLWNRLGTNGDCSNLMNNTAYDGFAGNGGFCNGLGEHNGMNNYTVSYNVFTYNENESKFYETSGRCVNCVWTYNDFTQWHRIAIENQSNSGSSNPTNQTVDFNSIHDANYPATGTFGLSIANGCTNVNPPPGTSSCVSDVDANVIAANTPPALGPPYNRYADSIEWWGSKSTINYNFLMGMANSIMIADDGSASVNNNLIYNPAGGVCTPGNSSGGFFNTEDTPANTATGSGNTCVTGSGTQLVSVAPNISPASGSFTGTQTWNVTNPGTNRDANTNAWCTTDGSTPVPGQGTAVFYASGTGGTVSATTTVKCVGMWGAGNQPASWPSGYGYSQSAVVQATYTAGGSGTCCFISTTGNDSNPGTMASPWLTPNHAMTCGTTITALAGTYSASNFTSGKWGTVTCPSSNNVAWVTCATFDACKISSTSGDAIWVDQDYWGVTGFETTTASASSNEAACFRATPSGAYILHHVIFANDIANGCKGGGFISYNTSTTASTDYLVLVGDIAYNAAQGAGECFSGFSIYEPINYDTVAGTHLYAAGNFSYANVDPNPCAGGPPTDGEAIIFDTFDGRNSGTPVYTGQAVMENNIGFFNGGRGFEVLNNSQGTTNAAVYVEQNTSFGNSTDNNQTNGCFDRGELYAQNVKNVTWQNDLAQTRSGTSCSSAPLYGFSVLSGDASSNIGNSWWSGTAGNNTDPNTASAILGAGNTVGTNPAFSNPVNPGAPSCGSFSSTLTCMAAVIADYVPTVDAAVPYGYQTPTGTSVTNALFPQWLCSGQSLIAGFPTGLIDPGCGGPTPTLTGGYQGNTGSISGIMVGAAGIQQTAYGTFTDGSTHALPYYGYTAGWSSSNTAILGVSSSGLITGVSAGSANSLVVGNPGSIAMNPWGWTVTGSAPPIPSSGYLGNPGGVNNVVAGSGTIQFTAYMCYSNISGCNALPDGYGNSVLAWSVSGSCGSISSGGLFNPTTPGTCNVVATCNCTTSAVINPWTMTVTRAATPAPPEVEVIVISEGGAPREWQDWTDFTAYVARLRGEVGGWN